MARNLLDLMIRAKTPSWQRGGEKFGAAFTQAFTAVAERKWKADADFERMKRQADFRVGPEAEEFSEFEREQDILGKKADIRLEIGDLGAEAERVRVTRKIEEQRRLKEAGIDITPPKAAPVPKERVETEAQRARITSMETVISSGQIADAEGKTVKIESYDEMLAIVNRFLGSRRPGNEREWVIISPLLEKWRQKKPTPAKPGMLEKLKRLLDALPAGGRAALGVARTLGLGKKPQIIQIKGDADFKRLTSGTTFRDPAGNIRIKP